MRPSLVDVLRARFVPRRALVEAAAGRRRSAVQRSRTARARRRGHLDVALDRPVRGRARGADGPHPVARRASRRDGRADVELTVVNDRPGPIRPTCGSGLSRRARDAAARPAAVAPGAHEARGVPLAFRAGVRFGRRCRIARAAMRAVRLRVRCRRHFLARRPGRNSGPRGCSAAPAWPRASPLRFSLARPRCERGSASSRSCRIRDPPPCGRLWRRPRAAPTSRAPARAAGRRGPTTAAG